MTQINTEHFFQNEYSAFAAYDLIRKIAHVADGLKNASRKIVHYSLQNNLNSFQKVTNLAAAIQQATEYLHGSLEGTVVNVTQDFVGANNVPLLIGDGTFGTRFIQEAAASRYIFAKLNPQVKQFFNEDDYTLLEHQEFEGTKIEPKYYVSTIPLILVNGSVGVSVGYSQKILPRKVEDIVKAVVLLANGKKPERIVPYYKGFKGTIEQGDGPAQWIIKGTIERQTKTQLIVTEVPIGYDLQKYIGILEKLVETGKIKGYADESEDDNFRFVIGISRETGDKTDDELLTLLKLVTPVTENYTAIGRDNKVYTYNNELDIIAEWLNIRLEFNAKRKTTLLATLHQKAKEADLRVKFINAVINKHIILERKTKADILSQIATYDTEMEPFANSFMSMPLWSISQDTINDLINKVKDIKEQIDILTNQTENDILLQDLKGIKL